MPVPALYADMGGRGIPSFSGYGHHVRRVFLRVEDAGRACAVSGCRRYGKSRPYIVSALNIIGDILLVHFFGLDGVVFATLFTSVCMSYPWLLGILFKRYFKDRPWDYLKRLALQCGVVVVAGVLTYFLCYHVVAGYSFVKFVIRIVICAVVPNLIFICTIGRNKDVHELISKLTKGRI